MILSIIRVIVRGIFHLVYNLKITGMENVPKRGNGGFIVACNHQSYLDPVFIGLAVKHRYGFMAKEELFQNKAFARLISSLGAFPIKRGAGDGVAIEKAVEVIEDGRALVIFPEGTRNKARDGKVLRGKSGVSVIVSQTGAQVVPMAIWYGARRPIRRRVTVCVGKRIEAEQLRLNPQDRADLRRVTGLIMGEIGGLLDEARARG